MNDEREFEVSSPLTININKADMTMNDLMGFDQVNI
jgi:hypothetical protein